jgi:hypothetical protein
MTTEFSMVYDEPYKRRSIGTCFWSNERVYHILEAAKNENFFGAQADGCEAWLYLGKEPLDTNLILKLAIPLSCRHPSRDQPFPPSVYIIPTGHISHWSKGKFLGSGLPGAPPHIPAVTEVKPREGKARPVFAC